MGADPKYSLQSEASSLVSAVGKCPVFETQECKNPKLYEHLLAVNKTGISLNPVSKDAAAHSLLTLLGRHTAIPKMAKRDAKCFYSSRIKVSIMQAPGKTILYIFQTGFETLKVTSKIVFTSSPILC